MASISLRGVEKRYTDVPVLEDCDLDIDDHEFVVLKRRPKQLSGGQRQRVALGRAIVRDPAVFLPTSRCRTWTRTCGCRCARRSCACTVPSPPPRSTSRTTRSGHEQYVHVDVGEASLVARRPREVKLALDEPVTFAVDAARCHLFDPGSGEVLR